MNFPIGTVAAVAATVMIGVTGGALVYQLTSDQPEPGTVSPPEGIDLTPAGEGAGPGTIQSFEVFAPKDPFSPSGGGTGARPPVRIQMLDVADGSVVANVDGTEIRAAEGEVFASYLMVLGTDGTCSTLLFGDEQFSLCEGEAAVR